LICNLNLFGYSPALNRAQLTRPVRSAALAVSLLDFFLCWAHILVVTEQAVWVFGNIVSDGQELITPFNKETI